MSTSSRDAILQRIAANLGTSEKTRKAAVANRIKLHSRGTLPDLGQTQDQKTDKRKLVERFCEKAQAASASIDRVKRSDIAKAVSSFLREHNLPQAIRLGADKRLKQIAWPKRGGPELRLGASDGNDLAGLSHAFGGAAETGTLVMVSGADNPTTINFLPENHIVIVNESDIEAHYESLWTRLRKKYGTGEMPRTVNMITGPSRSADIEQTLILGAHGPVRLHIIVARD
ncbi:MAG: lactate utilization protein [Nitratireductor sp.]|nr:lactate utilization protein [Nitratireductor sp.]